MALAPRPTRAFRHVSSPAPTFASAPRPAGRAYPAVPPPRARPAPRQPRAAAPQTPRDASARPPRAPQSFRVGGHGPAPAPPQGRWEPRRRHRGWERGDVRGCGGARSSLWRSVERGSAGSVRARCGVAGGACAGLRAGRVRRVVRGCAGTASFSWCVWGPAAVGEKRAVPRCRGEGREEGRERGSEDVREEAGGPGRSPRERGGGGCGVSPERGRCMAGDEPLAQGHSVAAGYK